MNAALNANVQGLQTTSRLTFLALDKHILKLRFACSLSCSTLMSVQLLN